MKKTAIILMALAFLALNLPALELENLEEAGQLAHRAVDLYTGQKYQEGMDLLKPYWAASPELLDNLVGQMENQWDIIQQNYGKKLGMESVGIIRAGDSLAKVVHLVKFETYALRFETTFYRPAKGWIVVGFNFDDKILELLK